MILVFSSNELDFLILQNGKDGEPGKPGESGSDAYTIILGNENVSFSVEYDSNSALSDQNYSSTVQIMQGVEERTDFTIGEISSANGVTVAKNDQDKTIVLSVKKGDIITADSGYFRIPINIDGLVFFKDLTWSLSKQGEPGEQGEPGRAGEGAVNVVVANESQTIACTNDGLVSENVLINIPFVAFKGLEKVPCSAVVGVLPSGITLGSNTAATVDEDGLIVLNVAAKSNLGGTNILSGYVNLTFSVENQTILKRFIWTKTKDGKDGNTYSLELSSVIVNKNYDGTISPQSITLNAYYQNGNERAPYEGRFIIAQSVRDDMYLIDENNNLLVDENNNLLFVSGSENSIFENVYVSSKNESTYTYTLPDSISGLVCYLCKSDSITNILDQQTVTVLNYIDDIKPIITEITTTMSGVSQKVDAVEQSITNKVWQNDITNAINNYDGTTVKTIRDQIAEQTITMGEISSKVSDIESEITTLPDGTVIQELTEKVSELEQNADGFKQTVEENYVTNDDLSENSKTLRSEFNQTASEFNQSVTDLKGNITSLTQDLSSIEQRVEDAEGNISILEETSEGIKAQVENNSGDISILQQDVSGFNQTVSNLEGDISTVTQNVENIAQRVSNAEGNISTFQQTASNLQTQITNNAGNISKLQQDAEGFKTTVSNTYVTKENAITNTQTLYYLSSSTTSLSGGSWTEIAPEWTQGKYMWSKIRTLYADGTSVESDPVCIAGAKGDSGTGILSTSITYQVSSSGTSVPTGNWSTSIPTVNSGQYLWTKTEITYTDESNSISYSVSKAGSDGKDGTGVTILGSYDTEEELREAHPTGNLGDSYIVAGDLYVWNGTDWQNVGNIQGPPGATGEDGNGIVSTSVAYQVSDSGTVTPSGTWQPTIPEISDGQYLWTRTIFQYTNNTSTTSYSVSRNGDTGSDGRSVESIVSEYYLSTSKEEPIGGAWITTSPAWSSGLYVWTRSKITYKNPSSVEYTEPICDSSWEAVNDIEVGGRNLWLNSSFNFDFNGYTLELNDGTIQIAEDKFNGNNVAVFERVDYTGSLRCFANTIESSSINNYASGEQFILSAWIFIDTALDADNNEIMVRGSAGDTPSISIPMTTETRKWIKLTSPVYTAALAGTFESCYILLGKNGKLKVSQIKLEKGNKPTDWTPAPEDMATSEEVQNAQDSADEANDGLDDANNRLDTAESTIEQLSDSISMLITDENGESMMTQTSDGWRFDISNITNSLEDARETVDNLSGTVGNLDSTVKNLDQLIDDITKKTAYIIMTTDDEGNPCIELGKEDNPFKVRITNTSVDFMEGTSRIAYVSNKRLFIETAIIKNELQIGEGNGFIWKRRSNGNMGLRWIGGVN